MTDPDAGGLPQALASAPRCASCSHLGSGFLCRLRDLDVKPAEATTCASHSETTRNPDPVPVGPMLRLEDIGYAPADLERLLRVLAKPARGLVVVSGPAGSGKTSTMYASLKYLAGPDMKILTLEDPVEVVFPWMVQTQVNPAKGLTFASGTVAMFRSDPDAMMIGEVRDGEVLHMATAGSLTGRLVLTTLHTSSAVETLLRMVEMGCEPFQIADIAGIDEQQVREILGTV